MQYTVVHSKDPYLLARLATDLQMEGFNFQSHDCNSNEDAIILELTEDNYIKVLTKILQQ
jgi:hypothetical protein